MTVLITLTIAGANTGPFNLYSDVDGYTSPFESGIAKASLLSGYTSVLVPLGTTVIRVISQGECTNYIDLSIVTTTTTTTTSTPTTTTTTTSGPIGFDYYLADRYTCDGCTVDSASVGVCFPTGTSVTIGKFYNSSSYYGVYTYEITASNPGGTGMDVILELPQYNTCTLGCLI